MNRPFLIMRLEAPMMSFGTTAVDHIRPSGDLPGLSMITGLLARALGWNRPEHAPLIQELQDRVVYAARAEKIGHDGNTLLTDYQTAELGADDAAWTTTGRPEVRTAGKDTLENKHIRLLEYRTDLRVTVALELDPPQYRPTLDDMAQALQYPASVLFIGRKSCLPSHPVYQGMAEAQSTLDALHGIPSVSPGPDDPVLWNGDHDHASTTLLQTMTMSDLKDWTNNIHTGRRTVATGTMAKIIPGSRQ